MATTSFELQAESRSQFGKGHTRRMRRIENKIPGVIYGAHKETASITLDHNEVLKALENEAFYSHILTINLNNKKEKVILKDLQRHVYKPKITHMDFLRVSSHEALKIRIPIHFKNEDLAPGVKLDGGIINHYISDVEISCLPADLPEFLEIDVAELNIGDVIYLSQIQLPQGVSIVELQHGEGHDQAVVGLQKPAEEVEEEATLEAESEDADTADNEKEDEDSKE